jgi:hypothetical protein
MPPLSPKHAERTCTSTRLFLLVDAGVALDLHATCLGCAWWENAGFKADRAADMTYMCITEGDLNRIASAYLQETTFICP